MPSTFHPIVPTITHRHCDLLAASNTRRSTDSTGNCIWIPFRQRWSLAPMVIQLFRKLSRVCSMMQPFHISMTLSWLPSLSTHSRCSGSWISWPWASVRQLQQQPAERDARSGAGQARTDDDPIMSRAIVRSPVPNRCQKPPENAQPVFRHWSPRTSGSRRTRARTPTSRR